MATEKNDERWLSEKRSARMRLLGFDPLACVYTISGEFDFDLTDVQRALFSSTFAAPGQIPIVYRGSGIQPLPVIPESVTISFCDEHDGPFGHCMQPEWYVRGRLPGLEKRCGVHLLLIMDPVATSTIDWIYAQIDGAVHGAARDLRLRKATGDIVRP